MVEEGGLLLAVDGLVKLDALGVPQQGQRLLDGLGIHGVGGMGIVGEGAAVQIGDQRAGALVAVLAGAVHGGHILAVLVPQGLHRLGELLGGPGTTLQVDVLVGARGHEGIVVDGHALDVHGEGIGVALAVRGEADAPAGFVDLLLVGVVPHVGQVGQHALSAPDLHQPIRLGQQDVGRHAAVHGGAETVVAGGLVQALHRHMDVGIHRVELGQQVVHRRLIGPVADGICPQRQLDDALLLVIGCRVLTAGRHGQHQRQGQQECQQFFHLISSLYTWILPQNGNKNHRMTLCIV